MVGLIQINGKTIFEEQTSDNTQFCLNYALAYTMSKPTKVTERALREVFSATMSTCTGFDDTSDTIGTILNAIERLSVLFRLNNIDKWNPDGTCDFRVALEDDKCPNMPYFKFYGKYGELLDTSFPAYTLSRAITAWSKHDKAKRIIDRILHIQTREDVLGIIKFLNYVYQDLNKRYTKQFNLSIELINLLGWVKEQTQDVFVSYVGNFLTFACGPELRDIYCDRRSTVNLFFMSKDKEQIRAEHTIQNMDDLRMFCLAGEAMPPEMRNEELEQRIRTILNGIEKDEPLCFIIKAESE